MGIFAQTLSPFGFVRCTNFHITHAFISFSSDGIPSSFTGSAVGFMAYSR